MKKLCLLGDPMVGKTSLVRRYVHNSYDPKYLSTVGALVNTRAVTVGNCLITLSIWDIAGQPTSRSLSANHYRGSQGAIMVCDITRRSTLENLPLWAQALGQSTRDVPVVVMVNKMDLWEDRQFDPRDVARVLGIETGQVLGSSAKTGENVEKAFGELVGLMVKD